MTKGKVVAGEKAFFAGPPKVMKNGFRPEATFHRKVALSFVIPKPRDLQFLADSDTLPDHRPI
jgi:hypothetical protein